MSILSEEELFELGRIINHDLKAPLRHIQEFHNGLVDGLVGSLTEKQHTYHKYVVKAQSLATKRTEGLANFLKICGHSTEITEISLIDLIESSCLEVDLEKIISIKLVSKEIFLVNSDRILLQLILTEVISNALRFHPSAKQNALHKKQVELSIFETDAKIEILVSDNGIGIDPASLETVFKPFRQLNTKESFTGIGMGLALVNIAARKLQVGVALERNEPGITARILLPK